MKRGTFRHPKTAALAVALGTSRLEAFGVLGALTEWVEEYAPAGDIGRWPDATIAAGIDWPGDPARLVAGLCATGWLDRHPAHRLVVHDWWQHAQYWVHRLLARSGRRFATGELPSLARCSRAERAEFAARLVAADRPAPPVDKCAPHLASPRLASPCEDPDPPHARTRRPPRKAAARPAPSEMVEKREPLRLGTLFEEALRAQARARSP